MTDLISSLAESIVALVNSKPQSPTKDEVEAEIRRHLEPRMVTYGGGATETIYGAPIVVGMETGRPYSHPSPAYLKALGPCPVTTDGVHAWGGKGSANSDRIKERCPCGATNF